MVQGPPQADGAASMTRRDRIRADGPSFTTVSAQPQASAWTRDLGYGAGMTLMAMALAFGFTAARPRPKRRPPEAPAPAWVRRQR